jgi:hypothetical protein
MIFGLVQKFKKMWHESDKENDKESDKENVEGYILSKDDNKTLLLVKDGEKSWKTKWFNTDKINLKSPDKNMETIFKNTA